MLRPLDAPGFRDYLHEIRPRFITLRIHHGRTNLRWFLPTWALEEPLRYLLRTLAILHAIAPHQLARLTQDRLPGLHQPPKSVWKAIDDLFSERGRDLLAMPTDEPILEIDTHDTTLRIAQTRL